MLARRIAMSEPFALPTALTEAFHSLKISEQPRNWEFKSAVDSYTLNLEWPKEAGKRRHKHRKTRSCAKRAATSKESCRTESSKEEEKQVEVHTTLALSQDSVVAGMTASEAGGLSVDKEKYQKSEIPKTCEGEHKIYSAEHVLDEGINVSEAFSSKKENHTNMLDISKTDDQGYTEHLAKNLLENENEAPRVVEDYSAEQEEGQRSTEFSKTQEQGFKSYLDKEGSNEESNNSEIGQLIEHETGEDETLKFKMNKFFEEENKVLDQGSKMSEVEDIVSDKREWESEDITGKAVLSHTKEPEYKAHSPEHTSELGDKTYEMGGAQVAKHQVAELAKSEKSDLSKHYENGHKFPSGSVTSKVEEIIYTKYERERSFTQTSMELKKYHKQEDKPRSSIGGTDVVREKTQEVHDNRSSGIATPQSSRINKRDSDSCLGEHDLRPKVDKVVTQAKQDLENIDIARERRRGTKSSDSVTSSSELSVSLRHVRYRRTQYSKTRRSSKLGKEMAGSTTTESDIQASSEASQSSDRQSKVSSHSSKRTGSSRGSRTRKPRCCCGQKFSRKENAVHHVLFECSVSVCFRVYLDIKVNRMIDRWGSEANRIMGREWWQMYRTGCFPDVDKRSPVLKEIQNLVSEFIEKVSNEKFVDKQGGEFVLFEGLESLP